jgi:hypothetical protein
MSSQVGEPKTTADVLKYVGIGAVSLLLNYLVFGKLLHKNHPDDDPKDIQRRIMNEVI